MRNIPYASVERLSTGKGSNMLYWVRSFLIVNVLFKHFAGLVMASILSSFNDIELSIKRKCTERFSVLNNILTIIHVFFKSKANVVHGYSLGLEYHR